MGTALAGERATGNLPSQFIYSFEVVVYDKKYPLFTDPVLSYSTYHGGSSDDVGEGIAVDGSGSAYVTKDTYSSNFPITSGAYDTTFNVGTYVRWTD